MANIISEGDRDLVRLDYSSLLEAILKFLQNPETDNLFRLSKNGQQLLIDIDKIAYFLAKNCSEINSPFVDNWRNAKVATINFTDASQERFVKQNREIRECLQQQLQSLLEEQKQGILIEDYLEEIQSNITDFQEVKSTNNAQSKKSTKKISFNYDFKKKYTGLSKQRLTLKNEDNDRPLLKCHRLTISIENTSEFDGRLKESINNYIDSDRFYSSDREELKDILDDLYDRRKDSNSDWYALKRLLDTDAIAKVKRTAKIKYLEYILEHIGEHKDAIYLEILISRLKIVEEYFSDSSKPDGHYQVNYGGESYNLREIFAEANVFDCLPIIPLIEGNLGEIRDETRGVLQFIFGLKFKFGNKIQTEGGLTVLDYNLEIIDPSSKRHQEYIADTISFYKKQQNIRKILQRSVLYFFVFSGQKIDKTYSPESDLNYPVVELFESKLLPVLKVSHDNPKQLELIAIFNEIKTYGIDKKIDKLKKLLTGNLNKPNRWNLRDYPIQTSVKQSILRTDARDIANSNKFFQDDLRHKNKTPVKYIAIGDAEMDTSSLCHLAGNIQIDELHYFETADNQQFAMEYDIVNEYPTVPILVIPQENRCRRIFKASFFNQKLIIFAYDYNKLKEIFNNSKSAFIYRFVFSLLSYISLKILLDTARDKLKRKLFIPILRLHLTNKQDPLPEEEFMRSNFKVLSHFISQEHRSSCQGFCISDIDKSSFQFKFSNGMSSLYGILPKKFKITTEKTSHQIDKLAIIVVSSRECDRAKRGDYKITNLTGEVIKIERQPNNYIAVSTSKTISKHYKSSTAFSNPDVLVEAVNQLYQQGYRHILYVAKSLYSQTLNMTDPEKNEELYFMSPSVIRNLKDNRNDLKIYPAFFDKYYAVSLNSISRKSLYIQDAEELTNLVNDKTKQNAVFFNLINGIQVGDDKYYNGIISYSTLFNRYDEEILDTTDILAGLIDNDRGLKDEILQFLTLFHFSRYESNFKLQLKLDPYQNIIDSTSIGALSIFPHFQPEVKFNLLAFFNEVADALDAKLDD